ncbi:MAG: hypothetical protein IVW57_16050, partial [Ktedonobacterales bacterium]|nr:hypothetical protein [Ktedonobacterales bacterium]
MRPWKREAAAMVKYWLFRVALAVVPRIPLVIARPLVELAALLTWALAGQTRRRAQSNLRHVPTLAEDAPRLRWAAREVFRHAALNYLDFFRGPRVSEAEVRAKWVIEGMELYHQALRQGKGLVILAGHFGNWEYGVSRLGLEGYKMVVPMERIRPEPLFQ